MPQAGGDPDLLEEPIRSERGGELGAQDLEGDGTVVPEIMCQIDDGHAAAAELAIDAIPIGQRGREGVVGVGRGGDGCTPVLEGTGYRDWITERKMARTVGFCQPAGSKPSAVLQTILKLPKNVGPARPVRIHLGAGQPPVSEHQLGSTLALNEVDGDFRGPVISGV